MFGRAEVLVEGAGRLAGSACRGGLRQQAGAARGEQRAQALHQPAPRRRLRSMLISTPMERHSVINAVPP